MTTAVKQASNWGKKFLISVVAMLIAAYFMFDLGQYLRLAYLKEQQADFQNFYADNQILTLGFYLLVYIATTALSLPGATILTLAGGALFGLAMGTALVSFASTIGATLAFLAARYVLRDSVQQRFGERLATVNEGIRREGAFYLFTLRLIPAFPFFVINLLMGLTPMRTFTYYWVSQVGMLPGTLLYVNAGTQLAQIDSLQEILSPRILLSFVLLGVFPLATKKLLGAVRRRGDLDPQT